MARRRWLPSNSDGNPGRAQDNRNYEAPTYHQVLDSVCRIQTEVLRFTDKALNENHAVMMRRSGIFEHNIISGVLNRPYSRNKSEPPKVPELFA